MLLYNKHGPPPSRIQSCAGAFENAAADTTHVVPPDITLATSGMSVINSIDVMNNNRANNGMNAI